MSTTSAEPTQPKQLERRLERRIWRALLWLSIPVLLAGVLGSTLTGFTDLSFAGLVGRAGGMLAYSAMMIHDIHKTTNGVGVPPVVD